MNYTFGNVLLLEFPSSDLREVKVRPVIVVLDTGDEDFLVAKVTSQAVQHNYDSPLLDWEIEGLRTESCVRSHKLFTLDKSLIVRRLGSLTERDATVIKEKIKQLWSSL